MDTHTNEFFDDWDKQDPNVAEKPKLSWDSIFGSILKEVQDKVDFELTSAKSSSALDDFGKVSLEASMNRLKSILTIDFTKPMQLVQPGDDKIIKRVAFEYTVEDGKWLDDNCKSLWGESRMLYVRDYTHAKDLAKSARAVGASIDIPASIFEYGPKEGDHFGKYIWFWNLQSTRKVSKKASQKSGTTKKTPEPSSKPA